MTKKIFHSILGAVVLTLILSFTVATVVLYDNLSQEGARQLKDELNLVVEGVSLNGESYLNDLEHQNYRITWIDEDGEVLFDTDADSTAMENHKNREEIKEAIRTGAGESTRYSDTLMVKMLYSARQMPDGTIIRISADFDSILALLMDMIPPMCFLLLLILGFSAFLAKYMAKDIVKPFNEVDLEHPADNEIYEEVSPFLGKINKQKKQIGEQIIEIRQKAEQFEQISSSMNEGMILLDTQGKVLSMNQSAKEMFGVEKGTKVDQADFLTIDRSSRMNRGIEQALSGKQSEFQKERDGKVFQIRISQIESQGEIMGVVILCVDVTEGAYAERNRREFTANVSHELKTPLQSIIGSAELLENDLVKPEDTKRFVGHMKNEAARMVSLIDDIIRLSQLDENNEIAQESVDLYDLTGEVMEVLENASKKKNVEMHFNGEHCVIQGVRRYLYEIIYNLCDNAIRYNNEGGMVMINLKSYLGKIVLSVKDTGIGIPAEHQSRIFERFYRVDKSHSKETGGTGLGLSIVKHAVAYHGGSIRVDSKPGKGTKITITF